MSLATGRLREERKAWRKDHPVGFVARPRNAPDGSTDLMVWDAVIPGKSGGLWENCELKLELTFGDDYPVTAPIVKFKPILWHMNVWADGRICLNLLNAEDGTWHGKWQPSITIKQVLLAIQELLDNPFPAGARPEVQGMWEKNRPAYDKRIKEEAAKYRATSDVIEIE